MKSFKKLLTGIGAAAVMAAYAPASATISLSFSDGDNKLLAFLTNPISTLGLALSNVNINGWTVNLTTASSDTPDIGMTIQGKLWFGATTGLPPFGVDGCTSYGGPSCLAANQIIMKSRVTDDTYPVPLSSSLVLKDVFAVSNTSTGSYGVLLASGTATPGIIPIPIGVLTAGQSSTNFATFSNTSANPWDMTAGVDLFAALNSNNAARGFQFSDTITVQTVPEPGSLALLGLGLLGVGAIRRKRAA